MSRLRDPGVQFAFGGWRARHPGGTVDGFFHRPERERGSYRRRVKRLRRRLEWQLKRVDDMTLPAQTRQFIAADIKRIKQMLQGTDNE